MPPSDGPMLSLGCGSDFHGDIRLDMARTEAANVVADASDLPFRDETFREVYEKNLLEHLPNVGLHLEEVKRVLRRGGELTLITDNSACLKYYLLGTHTGGYRKQGGKDVHYALFTAEHLRNFMRSAGMEIEEIRYMETDYFTSSFDKIVRRVAPSLSYPRIFVKARKP